ncbi:putative alcohol dehydrogenase [Penicillium brasilianum]|uniref:Putative alcohol dehydrogenase n=1 Tax=Penicillium brasilianum TaxID=104259 RepID=A0A1S9RN19_PENBI|nr:putative alcohol dehydrogenase [Penicillium brasilianum]
MTFTNRAAWLQGEKVHPMVMEDGPTPDPSENEVVIKVSYAAVNPSDWKCQDSALPPHIKYPFILGLDVAGTIVQLGSNVTRFKIGQRVIGHCDGLGTAKASNMGFQLYSTTREIFVSPIPDSLPLENAAVLPCSISTAATALFVHLKVPLPSLNPKPVGQRILVWGGSSSVGCSMIQLAVAAGLEVVTTASAANHDLMRSLGASHVFDYRDADVSERILEILRTGDLVVDSISTEKTQTQCGEILGRLGGGKLPVMLPPAGKFPENVKVVFVICIDPGFTALDVGNAVWREYIPEALATGKFKAKPDSIVIEGGLEKVQEGIDLLRKGVSATKIVINLS